MIKKCFNYIFNIRQITTVKTNKQIKKYDKKYFTYT